jgi:hypothetical protein
MQHNAAQEKNMGTNYYLHEPEENACAHCGRSDKGRVLHIGKSSGGWCFSLHVIPDAGINTLDDWRALWSRGEIRNECGDTVKPEYMEDTITSRGARRGPEDITQSWLRNNGAEIGPRGLARHQIGSHCIGHGEGTWDYILGEFS